MIYRASRLLYIITLLKHELVRHTMEQKFEFFDQLPHDLKKETISHLSLPELRKLSNVSQGYRRLFKPIVEHRETLQNFLLHVVRGEHGAVTAMLHQDNQLLVQRESIVDCSKRRFACISGFEYVLWALDKHMWTTMLSCIPQNKKGRMVLAQLQIQYHKVNTEGVTYTLHGNRVTEQSFDLNNTLIKALQTLVEMESLDAKEAYWCKGIGGAQKLLPMHVVAEYCSKEPFYPVPQFIAPPESSNLFYNRTNRQNEYWFSADSQLSVLFAILKGPYSCAEAFCGRFEDVPRMDLQALSALSAIRSRDFLKLGAELEALASREAVMNQDGTIMTRWAK